jgi:hypothetical protein
MFSSLDPAGRREALDPVEKLTDWEQFQRLASEHVPPKSKVTLQMKLINNRVTFRFLQLRNSGYRLGKVT